MNQPLDRMAAAQAAIRAGNKDQAREHLQQEVERHPRNFRAWLWLAGLDPSPQASLDYVSQAERINPGDPSVEKARAWAEQRLARQQSSAPGTAPAQEAPEPETATPADRPPAQQAATAVQQGQAPAAVSQDATTRPVELLREKERNAAPEAPPRKKRPIALVAAFLLLVIVVAAGFLWPRISDRWAGGAPQSATQQVAGATAGAAAVTSVPATIAASPESDLAVVSFVSGHFAPQFASAPQATAEETGAPQPTATPQPVTIGPKPVNQNDDIPRPTWTLTPSPTLTPTTTPTPVPTFVSEDRVVGGAVRPAGVGPNERWIDVNLSTQTLVAYEGDEAVFNSLVSSGTWLHPTVTGQFRVWLRYTAQTMDGRRLGYDYYLPNVPYVMYFYRDYALHGTYWHNNFGTPMSHGCVNLPTPAAEWIFNWSVIGTLVNVHY